MVRWPSHGPLPEALIAWCRWIYRSAELAQSAVEKRGGCITPDGVPTTWLDHCGMFERRLIEAAMHAGVFDPIELDSGDSLGLE